MGDGHDRGSADTGRDQPRIGRRPVLGALGTLGVAGGLGGTGAAVAQSEEWPSPDDPYYASLVEDLKGMDLPPAEFVYGRNEMDTMAAYSVISGIAETSSITVRNDVPFSEAVRVDVTGEPTNPWDVTMKATAQNHAVEEGDVLLGVASLRGAPDSTSPPTAQYVAKDEAHPATNMVRNENQTSPDASWKRYYFRIKFDYAAEAGTWWTELFLGYGTQTIDIGGLALLDFGQDVSLDQLPTWQPSYDYEGRSADADWREAAQQRIETHRTADLTVNVVDADGASVEGATVDVAMREHEFGFGTAVSVPQILGDGSANETYREVFLDRFNKAVLENGMKVPAWEGRYGASYGPQEAKDTVTWLQEHDIPIRGHTLLWATYDWMGIDPSQSTADIAAEVESLMVERAEMFEGDLVEWDMHNHPVFYAEVWEDVGAEYLPDWYEAAQQADQEAAMFLNEGGILERNSTRHDPYKRFIDARLDEGAPVDGIGFMGHLDPSNVLPPVQLKTRLDEYAGFGLPLQITEFDIRLNSRTEAQVTLQTEYLRDFLTVAFSHPAVDTVMSWGFWAEDHWRPSAAYYDSDWNLRPHGKQYMNLVFGEWWTEESGTSDGTGSYTVRGFKGDYEITASEGDRSATKQVSLSDGGASVDLTLTDQEGTDTTASDSSQNDDEQTSVANGPGVGILSTLGGLGGLAGYALARDPDD